MAQYMPLDNVYLIGKSVNIFKTASTISYVIDAIELTYGSCVRPYNGKQVLVPDELCSSFTGAEDTAVHFGYFHGMGMQDMSVYYRQSVEFSLGISLVGGASVDLLDAGAFTASFESEFSYEHFQSADANVFIGSARTTCYSVKFTDVLPMKPSNELKQQILSAPLQYDSAFYVPLIDKIGSHIFLSASAGGSFNEIGFAGGATMANSFATEQDMEVSCQANMWYTSVGYTDEAQLNANAQNYLHIVGANYNNHYVGPAPHSNDQKQYNSDVCSNPQPKGASLLSMPDYLVKNGTAELLGLSSENAATIANNIVQGMNEYCKVNTCYKTPEPVDPIWGDEVSVSAGQTAQLAKANEKVCVLSQVKSTSFQYCRMQVAQKTVGDANWYWYITASSDSHTACSARCSSKVSWAKNLNVTNDEIPSAIRTYVLEKPVTKGTFFTTLSAETTEGSFCMVTQVQNEVGCYDQCEVYTSGEGGTWVLKLYTDNPWDSKHQDLNSANRACGAVCFSVTKAPTLLGTLLTDSSHGVVPLTMSDDSICVCSRIQGVCSTGENGKGGSVHLKVQEVAGAEGLYWTVEGSTATGTDKCKGTCLANCYALK